MFELIQKKENINLSYDGKKVMEDMAVVVSLDNNDQVHLKLDGVKESDQENFRGKYKKYRYLFKDEKEEIAFALIFNCYEEIVIVYTDTAVKQGPFRRSNQLAAQKSIIIKVKSLGEITGLMANYLHKDWWTRPYFEQDIAKIPGRTQSLVWNSGEVFYHLLPVCDKNYKAELQGNQDAMEIQLATYTGGFHECKTLAFVLGRGDTPFEVARKTVKAATEDLGFPTLPIEQKRYPKIMDTLGWCTWDAFYHQVNEEGVINKAKEFQEKNLPVKWVIIDDGWLQTKEQKLTSFQEDPTKFPKGFNRLTRQLKIQYGFDQVGVWHAFAGYWGGIEPDSELAHEMNSYLYTTNNQKTIPYPEATKGFEFWNQWYTYLKQQGIDFVKVDGQSAINNFMRNNMAVGKSAKGAHEAIEAAIGSHFDNCVINCMGMASENIWNRPISAISRNSDDFVPDQKQSFKEHALQNAYNSFYHGQFYWGDWDMFWTQHEDSVNNAVLRAVSGGPIYFSDKVGETNPDILWPLLLQDGQIIRCDQPGMPTVDCLTKNPNEENIPLKVWNTYKNTGVIAAFNIHLQGNTVEGTVSPSDVPKLDGEEFIVYDYFHQEAYFLKKEEKMSITLEDAKVALYTIIPKNNPITPIGLINKYISAAGIQNQYRAGDKLMVQLKEGGTFGFTAQSKPSQVLVNGEEVEVSLIHEDGKLYTIDCTAYKESLIVEIIK